MERWLDACQQRRPDDAAVWRARLNWGIATNRIDAVQQAMTHVPAADSSRAQLHRLTAWLCAHRGDVESEHRELERLVAADPADLTALDRIAQIAERDGQSAHAAGFFCTKAKIGKLRARYQALYDRTQHMRDAEEMAHLAEQLGRGFEARFF